MSFAKLKQLLWKQGLIFSAIALAICLSVPAQALTARYNILGFIVPSASFGGGTIVTDPDNGFDLSIGQSIEFEFLADASLAVDVDFTSAGLPPVLEGVQAISLSDNSSLFSVTIGSRTASAVDDICYQVDLAECLGGDDSSLPSLPTAYFMDGQFIGLEFIALFDDGTVFQWALFSNSFDGNESSLFVGGDLFNGCGEDCFIGFVDFDTLTITPVPVPASALLLFSSIWILGVFRRSKN